MWKDEKNMEGLLFDILCYSNTIGDLINYWRLDKDEEGGELDEAFGNLYEKVNQALQSLQDREKLWVKTEIRECPNKEIVLWRLMAALSKEAENTACCDTLDFCASDIKDKWRAYECGLQDGSITFARQLLEGKWKKKFRRHKMKDKSDE